MNDTLRTVIVGFVSGLFGAVVATSIIVGDETPPEVQPASDTAEPEVLSEHVAAPEDLSVTEVGAGPSQDTPEAAPAESQQEPAAATREPRWAARQRERQAQIESKLRSAGWTDLDIDTLKAAQTNMALEIERQQYDAMRRAIEDSPETMSMVWQNPQQLMRDELGDDRYEQLLEATGRPATVAVNNVLAGSAGESAGLLAGDRIRRYGSERVFNEFDLMQAILQGEPGESVTIEVERDGATFHVTVPRGPLGTSRGMGMPYGPFF